MDYIPLAPPSDMGAPEQYSKWRHGQDRAMERLMASRKRFKVLALPTGVGKSLVVMTQALFSGASTVVLTSTKGLQDQYLADFGGAGLIDVRGMGNYPCAELDNREACDQGPCLDGIPCGLRERGCSYYDTVRRARVSKLRTTNYAFWMTQKRLPDGGLGQVDLLVCDEAHEVPEEVSGFMRVELSQLEVRLPQEAGDLTMKGWRDWALAESLRWKGRLATMAPSPGRRRLKQTCDKLERLAEAGDDWVPGRTRDGYGFQPKWPRGYAADWLWGDIKSVVFASATIRPAHLEQLGLTASDYDWIECPSPFPVGKRPIYHVPTVRMNWRLDEGSLGLWVDRIDQIIEGRLDRKGIIHTVSYERARYLSQKSVYKELFYTHESSTTRETVERFKSSPAPAILVSPSVHTGFNFPYEQATYQIIGKIPWPDTRSAVMQARSAEDKDYGAYVALTSLEQMAGRGNRAPDDYCETFIVDDSIRWMVGKHRRFLSRTFLDAYRSVSQIPEPARLPPHLLAA